MKRIFVITCFKSILWGALFFLGNTASTASFIPDSTTNADSIKLITAPDTTAQYPGNDTLAVRNVKKHRSRAIHADSVPTIQAADTLVVHTKEKVLKSPQRAAILSAVVPGLGQAYNGKYWKIPIIYGGAFALYYRYDDRSKKFLDFQEQATELRNNNASSTDLDTIDREVNKYNSQKSYAIIFLGILYLANVVDALTDAYFLEYDISDDLNLGLSPTLQPTPGSPLNNYTCGLTLSVNF